MISKKNKSKQYTQYKSKSKNKSKNITKSKYKSKIQKGGVIATDSVLKERTKIKKGTIKSNKKIIFEGLELDIDNISKKARELYKRISSERSASASAAAAVSQGIPDGQTPTQPKQPKQPTPDTNSPKNMEFVDKKKATQSDQEESKSLTQQTPVPAFKSQKALNKSRIRSRAVVRGYRNH